MNNEHNYAHREKVYIHGEIFPDIRVGMQKVNLTPTVEMVNGEKVMYRFYSGKNLRWKKGKGKTLQSLI